jgi:acyltransferase
MNIIRQRDVSVDAARGIGVILVVFGHTFQVYSVTSYVYAFHMPLFFLLSGYTFNIQNHRQDLGRFLRRNFLRLMVPYFGAAILSYLFYGYLAPILSLPEINLSTAAGGILNGNGINLPFNDVLWFLPAFFFAGIIFLALGFILRGIKLAIGVLVVSFLGLIIGLSYHLPFGLDIAMTMQFFLYCGHFFRKTDWLEKTKKSKARCILIALATIVVTCIFSSINGRVDLMTRIYGQPIVFFIAGISGSVAVLMISSFFSIEGIQYNVLER